MNESQSESIACLPLALSTGDGEVDLELLRAIPKPFSVTDRESANWLVRKIISAREYAAHVQAWATAEKRRAEREEATLMYLFGRQIESWAMDEVQKLGGRRKSVALPAGTLAFKSEAPKLVIDNDDVVLAWARKNLSGAIQIQEKLMKSVLNDHFTSTGEVPDGGAHVEPARERFSIR